MFYSIQCHTCFNRYGWHCRFLSWDDYFMAVAFLSSQRSKDPNKQVTYNRLLFAAWVDVASISQEGYCPHGTSLW